MSYKCDFCPGRTFKSQAALNSHQTQKKCNECQRRNISPSNPFLKCFEKKSTPKSYPHIEDPNAESILPIAKKRERFHKRKFIESDLKITDSNVFFTATMLNSPHTRGYSHTQGFFMKFGKVPSTGENSGKSQSLSVQGPHTGIFFKLKVAQHRENYENFESLSTEPTHGKFQNKKKLKVSQYMTNTHTENIQNFQCPQHRAHTQGK